MIWQKAVYLALYVAFMSASSHADAAPKLSIELENRFRLLRDAASEQLYAHDLNQRLACTGSRCDTDDMIRKRRGGDKNYVTRWESAKWAFEPNYVNGLSRVARVTVAGLQNASCDWTISGLPGNEPISVSGHQCDEHVRLPDLRREDRRLEVAVKVHVRSPQWTGDLTLDRVQFRDVVIATLGDSFLSGEGSPNLYLRAPLGSGQFPEGIRSEWLDVRCHRSLFTSGAIASFKLSQAHPTQSVTFAPLACSGAEIGEGLLKPNYLGRETPFQAINFPGSEGDSQYEVFSNNNVYTPPSCLADFGAKSSCLLPSQIDTLKATICNAGDCVRPDAMLVSSGGNEVGFGTIVAQIARRPPPNAKVKMLSLLRARFKELPGLYDKLHDALAIVRPRNVVAVGYLDPTQTAPGVYCDDVNGKLGNRTFVPNWTVGLGFGITKDWAMFARNEILLPLNKTVRQATERFQSDGWRFASLNQNGNGYCAAKSWFLNFQTSANIQGLVAKDLDLAGNAIGDVPTGAMHPNIFGHTRMAGEILAQFELMGLRPD